MMEQLYNWFESFLNELPPLLQLMVGIFIALGVFKLMNLVFEKYQKNKTKDD